MKVVDKRPKGYDCKLNAFFCAGETFIYDDELYMIIDFKTAHISAVSLKTGEQICFARDVLVTPVFVECHIVKNVKV